MQTHALEYKYEHLASSFRHSMSRSRLTGALVLGLFCAAAGFAAQPPKELVEYIREARKAGLNDNQIQQNALKAGWPAPTVTDAVEASRPGPTASAPGDRANAAAPTPEIKKPAVTPPPAQPASASDPSPAEKGSAAVVATPATAPAETTTKTAAPDRGVPDDYVIGEGDVLHISVWKELDASVPSVVVRPDGKITMPMLKDLQVSGLTPAQAEKVVTEQLSKFISAPDVTVIVSGIHSKRVYIVGGVKKEGPIPYTYRMTILQALSEAGGLTDYAKKKKIYVLRRQNGRDYQLPFDYGAEHPPHAWGHAGGAEITPCISFRA
jgi:polysaccharide export outer membrane protein